MGPHSTWYEFLPGYETLKHNLEMYLGRDWTWQAFQATHFEVSHILGALLVLIIGVLGGLSYRSAVRSSDDGGVVPPRRFGARAFFEGLADVVNGLLSQAMPARHVPRFLPLIGTLFIFILFSNLLSVIPGFLPPTDTLKTNAGLAVLIFLATQVYGLKAHGAAYLKHFLGPVWYLAPLMLPIEIIGHLARPLSLSMRLLGNITADHKVGAVFFGLIPLLIPVPFLVMGVFVSFIQATVFSLLSAIYIGTAIAHEEH